MVRSYRVRWLFTGTGTGPLLEDAHVVVADGRVVEIGKHAEGPVEDLGDSLLIPALVNAHTHLEFSDLNAPLGQPGESFPNWVRHVVDCRRRRDAAAIGDMESARAAAVQAGLAESTRLGVGVVGEIATPGWPREVFASSPLPGTVFLELLGLARERVEPLMALAQTHLQTPGIGRTWRAGLSPHAPYTVHPQLLDRACQLAASSTAPVAMHLAESREELELLACGTGPLVDLLREWGAWHEVAIPRGSRALDYLNLLARAPRSLVIHGNYLTEDEIGFIASHREQMTVVYCPRTHSYFGHDPYPLGRMLTAGVRVAVGTDSRASTPDLSVLAEMREAARCHPGIDPAAILGMGTDVDVLLAGDEPVGGLRVGRPFRALRFPISSNERQPLEWLLRSPVSPQFHVMPGTDAPPSPNG